MILMIISMLFFLLVIFEVYEVSAVTADVRNDYLGNAIISLLCTTLITRASIIIFNSVRWVFNKSREYWKEHKKTTAKTTQRRKVEPIPNSESEDMGIKLDPEHDEILRKNISEDLKSNKISLESSEKFIRINLFLIKEFGIKWNIVR